MSAHCQDFIVYLLISNLNSVLVLSDTSQPIIYDPSSLCQRRTPSAKGQQGSEQACGSYYRGRQIKPCRKAMTIMSIMRAGMDFSFEEKL